MCKATLTGRQRDVERKTWTTKKGVNLEPSVLKEAREGKRIQLKSRRNQETKREESDPESRKTAKRSMKSQLMVLKPFQPITRSMRKKAATNCKYQGPGR